MQRNANLQKHPSHFVSGLEITTAAFITELIITNKIQWEISKGKKISKPMCAFWRKDNQSTPELKALAQSFMLELTYIQDLIKIFSLPVILKYVKDRGIITIRFLPLDKQKTLIYNLYSLQLKHEKETVVNKDKAPSEEQLITIASPRTAKVKKGMI